MTLPKDAALRLARFCWPDSSVSQWVTSPTERMAGRSDNDTYCAEFFDLDEWDDIHAAQDVLIERGLGEEYGRALWQALGYGYEEPVEWPWATSLANAPKEARVRAMLTVIEEQGK